MFVRLSILWLLYWCVSDTSAQTFAFTSTCLPLAGDTVVADAFRNGCALPWTAVSGKPFLSVSLSKSLAGLKSGESIRLKKTFDKCSVHHVTVLLKLEKGSESFLELLFSNNTGKTFAVFSALKPGYANGWTSIHIHGMHFSDDYEYLTILQKDFNNTVLIDKITFTTECARNYVTENTRLSGKIQNSGTLNVSGSEVINGDSLSLQSDQHIILKNEVILYSGSETILQIKPCSSAPEDCKPEAPKELAVYNFLTPNGDGQNDTFFIEGLEKYPGTEVSVTDKTGRQVFHSIAYRNEWNGESLPAGIYVYQVKPEAGRKPVTGELLLVR